VEDAQRIIQELRQEIMFDENTISNLNTQLQKTQESNMQLVTEIEDLERALEQYRQELDDLKATKKVIPSENLESDHLDTEEDSESKTPCASVEIKDSCTAMTQTETQIPRVHSFAPVEESTDMVVKGLQNMVKQLQQDVEELEAESIRLTDENIDLQTKLDCSKIEIIHKNKLVSDLKADHSSESWSPRSLPSHYNRYVSDLCWSLTSGLVCLFKHSRWTSFLICILQNCILLEITRGMHH
jgi:regulator of replication initiation timing